MTVFLTIVLVALFGITLWQLSKIYQLSREKDSVDSTQIASNKDNRMQGNLMLAFGIAFYIFMLYCFWEYTDRALPAASSAHGAEYDNLLLITMVLIMFVQVITQGLLHYFAYKYHGKKGRKALFFADNDKLEFIWTIIPVIVLSGLIIYGLFTWSDIMDVGEDENPIVIELYAKQFDWTARYSGADNVLGKANVRFIEGMNTVGVNMSDPYAHDDIVTRELHLPVGRTVLFKFRSQDVLHSAYFPHFRAQMNVVPGMITQFAFKPTMTTEEIRETEYMVEKMARIHKIRKENSLALVAEGKEPLPPYEEFDYYVLCNKICGVAHYNMQMKLIVETPEEFQEWIAQQEVLAKTLQPEEEAPAAAMEETPEEDGQAATQEEEVTRVQN